MYRRLSDVRRVRQSALRNSALLAAAGLLRSLVGGSLLLPGILSELAGGDGAGDRSAGAEAAALRRPKAKRVIFLFSTGGVSHMDTFDPKPKLFAADGKTDQASAAGCRSRRSRCVKPRWEFKPGGKCGTLVSDLFPHLREQHGRHLPDPLDDDRQQRALPGDAGDPHRLVLLRPAEPRARGSATAWAR